MKSGRFIGVMSGTSLDGVDVGALKRSLGFGDSGLNRGLAVGGRV